MASERTRKYTLLSLCRITVGGAQKTTSKCERLQAYSSDNASVYLTSSERNCGRPLEQIPRYLQHQHVSILFARLDTTLIHAERPSSATCPSMGAAFAASSIFGM